jgi:hypothetical protein
LALASLSLWGINACGGAPPPPPAAPPAPAPAPPPVASEAPPAPPVSAEPAPAPPPSEPAPAASAAPEPEKTRRQAPTAILTARDVAFLIEYANSGARETADADCEKEAKGDLEVRSACVQKARDKFLPDVLRFEKTEQGKLSLIIYKRSGSTLREVYIGAIEFKDESEDAVKMRFTGREKGQRPLFRSKADALIRVPNDYSIEIEDPQFGKLTYSAKIGLVSAQ